MGGGDLEHAAADVARGDHVVAEQHEEGLAGDWRRPRSGWRGPGRSGLYWKRKSTGRGAGAGDPVGAAGLAAGAQELLEGGVGAGSS